MNVLDTSLLIEIARDSEVGSKAVARIGGERAAIASVSYYEFLCGRDAGRREQFLAFFDVLVLDVNAARVSARIFRELKEQGVTLSVPDAMIAGACLANDAILHTTDRVFAKIPGLKLELY